MGRNNDLACLVARRVPRFRVCSTCNYENCVCFTATGDRYTCERHGQILDVIARARFIDVNAAITVLAAVK